MNDERDGTRDEPEVEEAFVTALGEAARRLYNAPPETPADAMWDEIRAARARSGEERAGAAVDASWSDAVRPIESAPSRRLVPRPKPWWIGLAAALVIAFALGRISDVPFGPSSGDAPIVADAGVEGITSPRAAEAPLGDAEMFPYHYATTELIDRSETFLTMVREGGEAEESVDEVRNWARPLLTRTRLLLGSPAADDPELRALLDDLEVVLVQISQLPDAESEERDWIDEGLDESRLLFRLRAASTAGGSNTVRM
jgi:hypothetical protein